MEHYFIHSSDEINLVNLFPVLVAVLLEGVKRRHPCYQIIVLYWHTFSPPSLAWVSGWDNLHDLCKLQALPSSFLYSVWLDSHPRHQEGDPEIPVMGESSAITSWCDGDPQLSPLPFAEARFG